MHVTFEPVLLTFLILASATDLLWGKVYNVLTLPSILLGPLIFFLIDSALLTQALMAVICAIAIYFPLWLLGVFKAGDVKLAMAIAAWTSPLFLFHLSIAALFVGAAVGTFLLLQQAGLHNSLKRLKEAAFTSDPVTLRMPFAPALFCGFLLVRCCEIVGWL